MPGLIRMSLNSPEEVREFEAGSGQLELVNIDADPVGRATFQPGWRWSQHVKPTAKTGSCQAAHTGYFISGQMKVVMDDGEEMEYGPGDFAIMAPGHDAWVVGSEPCVILGWQGFADYAKPTSLPGPASWTAAAAPRRNCTYLGAEGKVRPWWGRRPTRNQRGCTISRRRSLASSAGAAKSPR